MGSLGEFGLPHSAKVRSWVFLDRMPPWPLLESRCGWRMKHINIDTPGRLTSITQSVVSRIHFDSFLVPGVFTCLP